MNNGVNDIEWITKVSEHPETTELAIKVAAGIYAGATSPDDIDGMHWTEAGFGLRTLVQLRFIEEVVDLDGEVIYELRIP